MTLRFILSGTGRDNEHGGAQVTLVVVVILLAIVGGLVVLARPLAAPAILVADSVILEMIHAASPTSLQYVPWMVAGLTTLLVAWRRTPRDAPAHSVSIGLFALLYGIWVIVVSLVHWPTDRTYLVGVPFVLLVVFWGLPRLVTVRDASVPFLQLIAVTALAGGMLAVAAGLAAVTRHVGFVVPVGHRHLLAWQWPFANKNTLGFLEAWAVPSAAGLAIISPGLGRYGWWLVAVVAALGLGFSYARTAWIAAVVGVLILAVGRWGWKGLLGVVVVGLGGAAVVVKKTGMRRLSALWGHGLSGRGGLWRAAWLVAHRHRVFGVGPGNSPAALEPFVRVAYRGLTPHDAFLETLVELGIP